MATEFGTEVTGLKANTEMERGKGSAKGVYYAGIAATGRQGSGASPFTLIASDMETLEEIWDQLMHPTPLNKKATYQVAIFQKSNVLTDES